MPDEDKAQPSRAEILYALNILKILTSLKRNNISKDKHCKYTQNLPEESLSNKFQVGGL